MVLAGGASRRMGQDKAQLAFTNGTLLHSILIKLADAGFEALVSGERSGFSCIPDNYPDCGPLGGIEAALRQAAPTPGEPVLFVPVDVPLLPAALLQELWWRAAASGAWATILVAAGRPQPLCAVYHSAMAEEVSRALEREERKVLTTMTRIAGAAGGIDWVRVEALAATRGWSGGQHWFRNLNTPEDYRELLRLTERLSCGALQDDGIYGAMRRGA